MIAVSLRNDLEDTSVEPVLLSRLFFDYVAAYAACTQLVNGSMEVLHPGFSLATSVIAKLTILQTWARQECCSSSAEAEAVFPTGMINRLCVHRADVHHADVARSRQRHVSSSSLWLSSASPLPAWEELSSRGKNGCTHGYVGRVGWCVGVFFLLPAALPDSHVWSDTQWPLGMVLPNSVPALKLSTCSSLTWLFPPSHLPSAVG